MIDSSIDWIEHGLVTFSKLSTVLCQFSLLRKFRWKQDEVDLVIDFFFQSSFHDSC